MNGEPERRPDEPPWRLWTVPVVLAVGLAIWIVAIAIVRVGAHAGGSSLAHPTPAVTIALNLAFDLSFVIATAYLTMVQGRARPADFGFRRVRPSLAVGAFMAAAILYYVGTWTYAAIFQLHGKDKLPSDLGVNKSTTALILAAMFVCVVAPIAEEFFFRGFVFGALRRVRIEIAGRELGTLFAAVTTGILFGLVHAGSASPQFLVPLGFLGFVLCLLRWRTRSLYPCMALHSFNNSLALGINELSWSAGGILGLIAASMLVIAVITGPLSRPAARPAGV